METIFFIVGIYGGIYLIYWFFEQIGKWKDEHNNQIRDEVAREVLSNPETISEIIAEYKNKLSVIGFSENQKYEQMLSYYYSRDKRSYRKLLGKCPQCSDGYLRIVDGKYGKFIGCSKYSQCRYTINLNKAKNELKEKSSKEFNKLFELAYK